MTTVGYFGEAVVSQAIADYYARYGLTEEVRDELMLIAQQREDDFFQMVCDFIEKSL